MPRPRDLVRDFEQLREMQRLYEEMRMRHAMLLHLQAALDAWPDDQRRPTSVEELLLFRTLQLSMQDAGPQGPPPIADKDLAKLKTRVMSAGRSTRQVGPPGSGGATTMTTTEAQDCMVCLEAMAAGTEVVDLPCGHTFCNGCSTQWLKSHRTCPVCRAEIVDVAGVTPPALALQPPSAPPASSNPRRGAVPVPSRPEERDPPAVQRFSGGGDGRTDVFIIRQPGSDTGIVVQLIEEHEEPAIVPPRRAMPAPPADPPTTRAYQPRQPQPEIRMPQPQPVRERQSDESLRQLLREANQPPPGAQRQQQQQRRPVVEDDSDDGDGAPSGFQLATNYSIGQRARPAGTQLPQQSASPTYRAPGGAVRGLRDRVSGARDATPATEPPTASPPRGPNPPVEPRRTVRMNRPGSQRTPSSSSRSGVEPRRPRAGFS